MIEILIRVRDRMKPPQWGSWQTLILLSAFSVIVAALTTSPPPQIAQRIISSFGWVFLILGVWWFVYEPSVKKKLMFSNFFLGPWIVGALICIYLFGTLDNQPTPTQTAFISWPPISAIIWSMPKFIKSDPATKSPIYSNPTIERRQEIVLVLLANLLISCWIQLYFQVQNWLVYYPNLQNEDFSRSAFLWRPERVNRTAAMSYGTEMIETSTDVVREQLEGKPWSTAERWLEQLDAQLPKMRQTVESRLSEVPESKLWRLDANVASNAVNTYDVQLQSVWLGPTSRQQGYQLTRTCRVAQGRKMGPPSQFNFNNSAPPATSPARTQTIATVQCGRTAAPSNNTPQGVSNPQPTNQSSPIIERSP